MRLKLEELESENQQLQRDMSDARTNLQNQTVVHEAHRKSEEDSLRQLEEVTKEGEGREARLKAECLELKSRNQTLTDDLERLRTDVERESEERVRRKLDRLVLVEQERDRIRAELDVAGTVLENATAALKFQLSSQNIELQQVREVRVK